MSQAAIDFAGLYRRLAAAERALHEPDDADRERVLEARSRLLARPRAPAPQPGLPVMAFRLAGQRFGVPLTALEEVVECTGLCPLPLSPRAVLGALQVRSGIVPVLDLRALLELQAGALADLRFVLVVAAGDERFGLAVEAADGALELEAGQLLPPPRGPFSAASTTGLQVLDLARLATP